MLQRTLGVRLLAAVLLLLCYSPVYSQDTLQEPKHAAIIFPYPMYKAKWRSSIGLSLISTPEDITEETQIRVPAIDFCVLRRINSHFIAEGRITAQILQNQFFTPATTLLQIKFTRKQLVGADSSADGQISSHLCLPSLWYGLQENIRQRWYILVV